MRKTTAIILSAFLIGGFYYALAGEPLDKYRDDTTHTGTLNVRIDATAKAGVWDYTLVNQDEPGYGIITFELHDLAETARIIGSPPGWKTAEDVMRSAPPGAIPPGVSAKPVIAWVADEGYEIVAGQSLGGFQISAPTTKSENVMATVTAMFIDQAGVIHPGRVAFKYTRGPGT